MPIETLEDWNDAIGRCNCCPMPECPFPEMECESITVPNCGHALPAHPDAPADCIKYSTKTTTYELNGSNEYENYSGTTSENQTATTVIDLVRDESGNPTCRMRYGQTWSATSTLETTDPDSSIVTSDSGDSPLGLWIPFFSVSGGQITANISWNYSYAYPPDPPEVEIGSGEGPVPWIEMLPDAEWSFTSPATFTRTYVVEYGPSSSDTITETVVYSGTPPDPFEVFVFPGDSNGEICGASRTCEMLTKTRFRWMIPDAWTGSYFKLTWDILEEPDGWDATINDPEATPPDPLPGGWQPPQIPKPGRPNRSFYKQNQTWVWSGPGDPEDEDSWKSGWYEIGPPDISGQRRVVNLRFECYRSPYGNKPQVYGEAVELDPPT